MSVSHHLICSVSDGSMNFPRNTWANVSKLVSIRGWGFPALMLFVLRVSQCDFHEVAVESSLIHAKAHAMNIPSSGKSVGCRVQ